MYILREKDELRKISNFFLSMNYKVEYYLFHISINTGIPISVLIGLKKSDVIMNGKVHSNLLINGKNYKIPYFVSELLLEACKLSQNDNLFMNESQSNIYSRTQFYKKIKEAEKCTNIQGKITNKSCEYTFAFHYLITTGNIDYLAYIFNKTKLQLISDLLSQDNVFEYFKII